MSKNCMWHDDYLPRCAIAICHTGVVTLKWTFQFYRMLKACQIPEHNIVHAGRGTPWYPARDILTIDALKHGAESIIFFDSDVVPLDDFTFEKLLRCKEPVVSAMYFAKKLEVLKQLGHCLPAGWGRLPKGEDGLFGHSPMMEWGEGLVPVDTVGAGALKVDSWVFRAMKPPWFKWTLNTFKKGKEWITQEKQGNSEDFYFCHKVAKELGIQPYIDTTLKCEHMVDLAKIDGEGRLLFSEF